LQQAISSGRFHNGAVRETLLQPLPARNDINPVTQAPATPRHSGRTEPISLHEPYVDAQEGAAFLGLHPKTLMRLAREGKVSAYSISDGPRRHWRFLISELDKWMKSKVNSSPHPVRSVSPERRK
jgi:excisionase family DNA binding protein